MEGLLSPYYAKVDNPVRLSTPPTASAQVEDIGEEPTSGLTQQGNSKPSVVASESENDSRGKDQKSIVPSEYSTLIPLRLPTIVNSGLSVCAVKESSSGLRRRQFEPGGLYKRMRALGVSPANDSCFGLRMKRLDPNSFYKPICTLGRSGNVIIAFPQANPFRQPLVIRRTLMQDDFHGLGFLKRASHERIVRVIEVFLHSKSIFAVYENMDVSLEHMMAVPVRLEEHQVATICAEVLKGVLFIHKDLRVRHGSINAANILFSRSGTIKIGNIAEALLKDQQEDFASDIVALGHTVGQLRNDWSEDAVAFLKAAGEDSCESLLGSKFVKKSRGHRSLLCQVHVALIAATKTWDFCEGFPTDDEN